MFNKLNILKIKKDKKLMIINYLPCQTEIEGCANKFVSDRTGKKSCIVTKRPDDKFGKVLLEIRGIKNSNAMPHMSLTI